MPSIVIREEDLTISNSVDVTANVVYVPGLASTGGVNEPTLCTTLAKFQSIFGSAPLKYTNTITIEGAQQQTIDVYERSYIYATELLNAGIPVLFERVTDDEFTSGTESKFASYITDELLTRLKDKWAYNIKFITTGGYPIISSEVAADDLAKLATVAATRGDCIALIDAPHDAKVRDLYTQLNTTISSNLSNFEILVNDKTENTTKYMSIFAPWATYNIHLADTRKLLTEINLPASFGYLLSLANSVENYDNPDYYAIAGVVRGKIPNIVRVTEEITGAIATMLQSTKENQCSINPILYVQNYGYCIWGNRTLFANPVNGLVASSFLNIRVMTADIKKEIYQACKELTFETNSTELWLKFKSKVEPLLNKMISNEGLEKYELQRLTTDKKATLKVYVKLYTLYAVEDFDITIGLTDSTIDTELSNIG